VPVAAVIQVDSPQEHSVSGDQPAGGQPPTVLTALRPVDGLLLLRGGLMRTAFTPVADAAEEFEFLTRWMQGVVFAALRYPHRPAALDEAIDLIADFAASRRAA